MSKTRGCAARQENQFTQMTGKVIEDRRDDLQ